MRSYGLFGALSRGVAGYIQGKAAGERARQEAELAEAASLAQLYAQQRAATRDAHEMGIARDRLELDRTNAEANRTAQSMERMLRREDAALAREAAARDRAGDREFRAGESELNRQNARAIASMAQQTRRDAAENTATRQGLANTVRLSSQFQNDPTVKEGNILAMNLEKVRASQADPSAAGDLSLVFAYMKMLDPGSVVRETEFANAQNAAGVPDRVRNVWNKLKSGERLTKSQRADFLATAEQLAQGSRRLVDPTMARYGAMSREFGVDSAHVAPDPFGRVLPRTAPAAQPAPAPTKGAIDLSRFGLEPKGRP